VSFNHSQESVLPPSVYIYIYIYVYFYFNCVILPRGIQYSILLEILVCRRQEPSLR